VRALAALVGARLKTPGDVEAPGDVEVNDATHDSRQVGIGSLFVAVGGEHYDGHDFVGEAIARGAVAVMAERHLTLDVPLLLVPSSRRAMAALAAAVQGYPSEELAVVGVTGTNGKTTVTHLIEAIARAAGKSCGLIGTIETRLGSQEIANPHTTPEATDFQRLLRVMADGGAEMVACEVSSHALALNRVAGTRFVVGAFTNLSQDHLDLHGSLEDYFEAKASLFDVAERKAVWIDDPFGARLAARHPDALTVGPGGEVWASRVTSDLGGTTFVLHLPDGQEQAHMNLPGNFNLANALVAGACAHLLGFSLEQVTVGLSDLRSVPGRFEVVSGKGPVTVVVDYAHTPGGIQSVIETARTLGKGRVVVVVGAGGDRDRAKRPAMGRAASGADVVIVTSDNPRSEDPDTIIEQVLNGVDNPAVVRISDRKEAIATALGSAVAGDIVLVLGKGHETGQEIDGVVHPFDDRSLVRELLAATPSMGQSP
jgi:UDP-N-acetylmuramoyl-L-alanyl-D-glutamate--2,6-diaminopimelate ligase